MIAPSIHHSSPVTIAPTIDALERAADVAWPAAEIDRIAGWRLRWNHGDTRRACSATPPPPGEGDWRAGLDAVEAWLARRGAPCVRLIDRDDPALDAELAARGYRVSGASEVWTRPPGPIAAPELDARAAAEPDETAMALYFAPDPASRARRTALAARLPEARRFFTVHRNGAPIAGALAVDVCGLLYLGCMRSAPERRREGGARAALAAALGWRAELPAFLQVENANAPARALYHAFGFRSVYGYRYRQLER